MLRPVSRGLAGRAGRTLRRLGRGTPRTAIAFPPCPVRVPPAFDPAQARPGRAAGRAARAAPEHVRSQVRQRAWTAAALALAPRLVALARGRAGRGSRIAAPRAASLPVSLTITSISPAYAARQAGGGHRDGDEHLRRPDHRPDGAAPVVQRALRQPGRAPGLRRRRDSGGFPGAGRSRPSAARSPRTRRLAGRSGCGPASSADLLRRLPAGRRGGQRRRQALVTSRTFLPFWPGKRALDPVRQHIAWIWPLIGQPQQSACGGLLTNSLATSLGAGGRLSGLLAAGRDYAASAHLTWAIDPALLSSAADHDQRRTSSAGPRTAAAPSKGQPAGRRSAWLARLRSPRTGQPVFVTPYADVDVAALIHRGLNDDLARAFAARPLDGQQDPGPGLHRASGRGSGAGPPRDWPACLAGRRNRQLRRAEQPRRRRHQHGRAGQLDDAAVPPARTTPRAR